MDFKSSVLPSLVPLSYSFEENSIESEIKELVNNLFADTLASKSFDANVLGMPHLGSIDLVYRSIESDGLVLMQGERTEANTRYLYRSWKARNNSNRGLHFLRTYLQMLFPNLCEVNQLWQDKVIEYDGINGLYIDKPRENYWLYYVGEEGLKLDGTWKLNGHRPDNELITEKDRRLDLDNLYLTSRIEIALDFSVDDRSVGHYLDIFRAVIPARFTPSFRYWLNAFIESSRVEAEFDLLLNKDVDIPFNRLGHTVSEYTEMLWKLGNDGGYTKISNTNPSVLGSFYLGAVGYSAPIKLTSDRISLDEFNINVEHEAWAWRSETLPRDPEYFEDYANYKLYSNFRKLDGSWTLSPKNRVGSFVLDGNSSLGAIKLNIANKLGDFKLSYTRYIDALLVPSRLTLSGSWKLGGARTPEFELEVFTV